MRLNYVLLTRHGSTQGNAIIAAADLASDQRTSTGSCIEGASTPGAAIQIGLLGLLSVFVRDPHSPTGTRVPPAHLKGRPASPNSPR